MEAADSTIEVLVATPLGCRVFDDSGERGIELAERTVVSLAGGPDDTSIAVVGGNEIWRRDATQRWTRAATLTAPAVSIACARGVFYAGTMGDAAIFRVRPGESAERLTGFDTAQGRANWHGVGPPLHVRALTSTADGAAILAAVHVGGMPRSSDAGTTWQATIPVEHDVHQVQGHPSRAEFVAAAAAVGLYVSQDGGRTWRVFDEGLTRPSYCLAVAWLEDEVLFSHEDGPFARRSQIWRWRVGDRAVAQVRDGLPEWLNGKVDTHCMSAKHGRAAVLDRGGTLWLSQEGSKGWKPISTKLLDAYAIHVA